MKLLLNSCLLAIVLLIIPEMTGRAQSLLVNFQASDYTGGNSWTDAEGNLTASYVGNSHAVANGTSVTANGGFEFPTGDVTGLTGLGSYTEAVGFTATSISGQTSSPYAFAGNGVFGGDISGFGAGDSGLSLSSYEGGIVAGGGITGGSDVAVDDPASPNGNFALNTPIGAVLVVQANTAGAGNPANGSFTLYVNGVMVSQDTGLNTQPFGMGNQTFGASLESYEFGVGTMSGSAGGFSGDITQEQIYDGALTASQAETLSDTISEDSVPEPRTWAMMSAGVLLLAMGLRTRRA